MPPAAALCLGKCKHEDAHSPWGSWRWYLVHDHPDTQCYSCLQVKTEISVESKHQTLQGLAFPLQLDAQQAIQALKQKKINYIQLVSPWHGSPCTSKHPLLWHFGLFCPFLQPEAGSGAGDHRPGAHEPHRDH